MNTNQKKYVARIALTLLEVLVVVAIIGIMIALLLPAVEHAGSAARRCQCSNNLKQIGLALHNYKDEYGCFPPPFVADGEGRPMHSWRVLILPFIEQTQLYEQYNFDEPWNSAANLKLLDMRPYAYSCPEDQVVKSQRLPRTTAYLAIVGPDTAWPEGEVTTLADITDGTNDTLLVVEASPSGVFWTEPRDLHTLQAAPGVNKAGQGISSRHEGGANACFADGSVKFLPNDLSRTVWQALTTIDGGESVGRDQL